MALHVGSGPSPPRAEFRSERKETWGSMKAVRIFAGDARDASADQSPSETDGTGPPPKWFSYVLGLAVLASLIVLVTHFSEERAFVQLARDAKPSWLVVAMLLQATT
jgi:hypothetical protein